MLGILIGTAAVILLVAVGTGISNAVQHQIETMGSFGVSAAVGVFFGVYPANRADRLTPIEALRYE